MNGDWTSNADRTTAAYEMDDRQLVLRGGAMNGQVWTGTIAVGKRVFCGTGPWSKEGVYLATSEIEMRSDGTPRNVTIPAFAPDDPDHG